MKIKTFVVLVGLFFVLGVVAQSVFAATMIRKRTGTIEIVKPDGTVIKVTEKEPLPDIPSGSTLNIVSGEVDVKPSEGFVNVVFDGTTIKVGSSGRVIASYDADTGKSNFKYGGEVSITKGDTTINLKKGQRAQIKLDKKTGKVTVTSVKGNIETITAGVMVIVPKGGEANFSVNEKTKKVSVESVSGELQIISDKGEVTIVAEGEELVTRAGAEPGAESEKETAKGATTDKPEEVQAEEPDITEEPAEPEFPEASPYQP